MATFVLQRLSPNQHQVREPLTKNRTYHAYRWLDIAIVNADNRSAAEAYLSDYLADKDFRLEARS